MIIGVQVDLVEAGMDNSRKTIFHLLARQASVVIHIRPTKLGLAVRLWCDTVVRGGDRREQHAWPPQQQRRQNRNAFDE